MARTHDELLKLMRGDPHLTDEQILSQNPDMGNFNDVPMMATGSEPMPVQQLDMPAEPVNLGPDGPSLFSRVSNAMQPLAKEVAKPAADGGVPRQLASQQAGQLKLLDMIKTNQAAPADPYGDELNDAALKAAQAEKAKWAGISTMGKAANQMLSASTHSKIDNTVYDEIGKHGEMGEKNIITRREGKDAELKRKKMLEDMADEDQMRDPNSPISVTLRESARLAGLTIPDNTSGKLLRESGINLGTLLSAKMMADARREAAKERQDAREESLRLRREQFEQKLKENEQKAAKDFSQFIEKDDQMKLFKKESVALGQVDNLLGAIKSGNTVAAGALGAKMARAMGEVGVLTAEDVARYVRSGALVRGTADKLNAMRVGKPTDATLAEIQQISKILQDSYSAKVQPIYDKYATRLSRIYDIPLDKAYYVMDLPEPSAKVDTSNDPRVDKFMKDNNIKDRKEAIKILKENGKI
jgi:hypothetical protein